MTGIVAFFASSQTVIAALSVSILPSPNFKVGNVATVTTSATTATPVGGAGPYTYAWTYRSGDVTITCSANTAQAPTFQATGMVSPEIRETTWRCVVTDSVLSTTFSDVLIHIERA